MLGKRAEFALLAIVLMATASLSWWMMLRPVDDGDPSRFDALPRELVGWSSTDIEMPRDVSEMLAADYNVQRAYRHPQNYVVFVYVGYYGSRRGGTPEHTPDFCYPSQGWEIIESSERRIGGSRGFDLVEFVVEKEGRQRLVHFWYRTRHASGITSILSLRLHHVWDRLVRNRGEGALVRLSTDVYRGDVEAARSRLIGLDRVVDDEIQVVWSSGSTGPGTRPPRDL